MSTRTIGRPEASELAEYQKAYVSKVPGEDIMAVLERQLEQVVPLIRSIDEQKGSFRYAAEKWTIKEVIGHLIDTERVLAYRALAFARNDANVLPGFDQDLWVQHGNYAHVTIKALADEFDSVRRSTIFLFRHLDSAAWMRRGIANNNPITVRASAYVIAGHTEHHLDILRSRYLSK